MTLYGSLTQVKKMMRPEETTRFGTDVDDRLTALQIAVTATLERELGRSFGVPQAETTDLVWGTGSPILLLPRPFRTVTAIHVGAEVSGGVATGGSLLDPDGYTYDPWDLERSLIHGVRLLSGQPWGWRDAYGNPMVAIRVTGQPAAADGDTGIPGEITYLANYLILELFKRENASPAGFTGPDGSVTPLRDPYKEPHVVRILELHRAVRRRMAV